MTRNGLLLFSCALSLMATLPAESKEVVLAPTTPWNLDASDGGCALRRGFGDARRPLILEMRRFAPGDRFEFSLGGDQVKAFGSDIAIYYGDLTPEASHSVQRAKANRNEQPPVDLVYTTSSLGPERDFSGVDLVTPEMEESVHAIAVKSGGRSIRLETGSLGKPFAAMRQCTAALVASWGLDERVQAGRLRQLRPLGQTQWAPEIQKIYPLELAAKGMQARVNVRILVDTDGKPTTAKFFVLTTTHSLTKSLATR